MPKYVMTVSCSFQIEVEDDDRESAIENTRLQFVKDIVDCQTEESIEYVNIISCKEVSE